MGIEYRLVCHKCRVRLDLGSNRLPENYEEDVKKIWKKLAEFLQILLDSDLGEREDRYILWGRMVELRNSLAEVSAEWIGCWEPELLLAAVAFVLAHPHPDGLEVISDVEEEKYDATDDYEEVRTWI